MNVVVFLLSLVLMVFGAVEVIRLIVFRLRRQLPKTGRLALVVLPTGEEDCEVLVRVAAERVNWMSLKPPCRLVCLETPETQEVLRRLSWDMPGLEVCGAKGLADLLVEEGH